MTEEQARELVGLMRNEAMAGRIYLIQVDGGAAQVPTQLPALVDQVMGRQAPAPAPAPEPAGMVF